MKGVLLAIGAAAIAYHVTAFAAGVREGYIEGRKRRAAGQQLRLVWSQD